MTTSWTTPADLAGKVRRRWNDGSLLECWAAGEPFGEIDLPIRGPRAVEIGDDPVAVRQWIAALEAGSHGGRRYELSFASIGGRHYGRNQIPTRARLTDYRQAWNLLGVAGQVAEYDRILALSAGIPTVAQWVRHHPLRALPLADEWPAVLGAFGWLDGARGSGRYLREISAPGVDTKFVERHRPVLGALLGVSSSATGFVEGLGLGTTPQSVRLRFAPGVLPVPDALSEATFRLEQLTALAVPARTAVIVENEISFLSVPVPDQGVVLWGKGFEVGRAGRLGWLADAEVHYWGDLDTHGFAILNLLRAVVPHARSFLMDRATLLAHRDRWVVEPAPTSALLAHLHPDERALYDDLVADRLGEKVRLEQERIDWAWATERLPYH
jgi:hypothetical protein